MALVAAIGGLAGVAAYIRARGQNKYDERSQLSEEQQKFRQAMFEQLGVLRTQVQEVEKRNDVLETEGRRQAEMIAGLSTKNEYQERQLSLQAEQIQTLREQNVRQAEQIAALTEEKAAYAQRVQIAEAKANFLERENNELRREVNRLKAKLPPRNEAVA